ncbi:hypothetical protein KL949_003597 [Ogataea haglerorum]|nr:hypothetical protein KL913_003509 [Ogataea haglerorum]KAG7717001.1 hypothetical protein KL949_003597 [Ogataea haglerorum]
MESAPIVAEPHVVAVSEQQVAQTFVAARDKRAGRLEQPMEQQHGRSTGRHGGIDYSLERDHKAVLGDDAVLKQLQAHELDVVAQMLLIGGNLKTQVLASQIGQHISKNTILNVSGKLFAGSEPADQDHELLVELVALVKAVLQSQPA